MIDLSPARAKQVAFIGITQNDLELLKDYRPVFEKVVEQIVTRFYEHLQRDPDLLEIIHRHSTIDRLKQTQRQYWLSLADGIITEEFIAQRIRIGQIHSHIGLTTDYYLGSYMVYLDLAIELLKPLAGERWHVVTHALSKMFNLDSQLVLEAYEKQEKNKLTEIASEKDSLLQAVTEVTQELTGMISELSENSRIIASAAQATAASQETAHELVEQLHDEVGLIDEMSISIREISDRTHLLGLNAAIEAAHAGENGRGFEVVAGEVRKLAQSSKQTLLQIQNLVEGIKSKLSHIQRESVEMATSAQQQAMNSGELSMFVQMIEKVADDLSQLQKADQ
ncbi:globin-coupled sensor protein [Paenibacillus fonticola]|uniref:globin-coupled sensor protein n=1 Tax=Paenibacillus fonticola TaxID=379896 RepID=UPI00037843E2|nr:globin-coupled sensor protein [Paenibacillus fonticola]